MAKAETYRRYATECLELASDSGPEARAVLLQMAHAWLRLADKWANLHNAVEDEPAHIKH